MVTKNKSEEYHQTELCGETLFFHFIMIFFPEYVVQIENVEE
jgi:hypothetical protein